MACARAGGAAARIVEVARYANEDEMAAEGALVVADAYQGLGLGTGLLRRLIRRLRSRGFRQLRGSVLTDNGRMLRLLRATGRPLRIARDYGTYDTSLDLGPRDGRGRAAPIGEHPLRTRHTIRGDKPC